MSVITNTTIIITPLVTAAILHRRTHGFLGGLTGFGVSTTREYDAGVKLVAEGATNGYPCCILMECILSTLLPFPVQSGRRGPPWAREL